MKITYSVADECDIEIIYCLCRQMIDEYEDVSSIDYDRVLAWVRRKLELSIVEYTAIYADGQKAGYYHFFKNDSGEYELDDLYVLPEFQGRGIGSEVFKRCCSAVDGSVMLYVFVKNKRAIDLYKRLGFEIVETVGNSRYIMKNK